MATRKKAGRGGTEPPDSGSRDQYTVILEDLRSQFKVFGEGLRAVDEKVNRHDRELGLVKAAIIDQGGELREIRGSLKRVEDGMAKKVDRDEVEAIVERVVARSGAR